MNALITHLERYSRSQTEPVKGSVIWLHGLGDSGHGFEPLVPYLQLRHNLRFIFPHAPEQAVTINGGMVMPSWYDIYSIGALREVSWEQVKTSVCAIEALINRELERGLSSEQMVIAGFSQGGAIALELALNSPLKFAGIMALSTYLFKPDQVPPASSSPNQQTPLLINHGRWDPTVPLSLAERSREGLERAGYAVNWKTYPMEHGVCDAQIGEIGAWLDELVAR